MFACSNVALRIHWWLSTVLKISNRSVWSNIFWYVKVYIYSENLFNSLCMKMQTLLKIPYDKINVSQKMHSFFFHNLQLITVLILIRDSYVSWSTSLISWKTCVTFSIFNSILSLLKFIFLCNKKHRLVDF